MSSLSAKILIPLAEYNRLKLRITQLENQLKVHVSDSDNAENSEGSGVKDINLSVGKPLEFSDSNTVPENIEQVQESMSPVKDPLAIEGKDQGPVKKARKWYYLGD